MKTSMKLAVSVGLLCACFILHSENQSMTVHWNCDGNNKNTVRDTGGQGNDGKMNNVAFSPNGKNKSCFEFNGRDSYISSEKGDFLKAEKGTISLWIKFENLNEVESFLKIEETTYNDFLVLGKDKTGRIYIQVKDKNNSLITLYTEETIKDKHWHNITVTQDGNGVKIYIDGAEALLCAKGRVNSESWTSHLNNPKLEIGRGHGWNYFKGFIDDVKIFNRALSHEEIRNEANLNVKVAIYVSSSLGAKGIYEALKEKKYITADLIDDLNIGALVKYNVLVIPLTTLPLEKASSYRNAIINYVKNGYGVIFFHDSCGYRRNWSDDNLLFPEIASPSQKENSYYMKTSTASSPITDGLPQVIKHSYWDHICMVPGKNGKPVLYDENTKVPTLVIGTVGYGKVVKSGNLLGINDNNKEVKPSGDELKLLINCVLWANSNTPKKLSDLKSEDLSSLAEIFSSQIELEEIRKLLQDKIYYYQCRFKNNLELLEWDIKGKNNIIQEEENKFFKKLDIINKNYLGELDNVDLNVKKENDKLFGDLIFQDKDCRNNDKLRDTGNKITEYKKNSLLIQKKLSSLNEAFFKELDDVRKSIPSAESFQPMDKMKLQDINTWLKNNYIKEQINFHGLQNPGLYEAMGYFKKIDTDILMDNITFREKSFDFKSKKISNEWLKTHGFSSQEQYFETFYGKAAVNNVRIISTVAYPELIGKEKHEVDWGNDETAKILKDKINVINDTLNNYSAFIGFHFDEIMFTGGWSDVCVEKFRTYLKNKYTEKERKELNLPSLDNVLPPQMDEKDKDMVLWTEHRDFAAEMLFNAMKNIADHIHSHDKIIEILFSPAVYLVSPRSVNMSQISKLADIVSIDLYWQGSQDEAFMLDLLRGNTKSCTQATLGLKDDTPERIEKDFSIAIAHADSLYPFNWIFYWKDKPHPVFDNTHRENDKWNKSLYNSYMPRWVPGGWNAMCNIFDKLKGIERFLIKTKPVTPVALLYSERSMALDAYTPKPFTTRLEVPYAINQMGIYFALSQEHIQVQPVYTEGITLAGLKDFKALILSDARSLNPSEIDVIKEWIKTGGNLLATASTTAFDKWGRLNNDYIMEDVFGCKYIDTSTNVNTIKTIDKQIIGLDTVQYLSTYKFDIVKATTAKVIAEWENKSPAVMINKYGKGNVIFISARELGRCFTGKGVSIKNVYLDKNFNPGIRQLFKDSIMHLLRLSDSQLPFDVINCPALCEVTLRRQDNLYMMHFLNYSDEPVNNNITVKLNMPVEKINRIFYPVNGQKLAFSKESPETVSFQIKKFNPHEIIVIDTKN